MPFSETLSAFLIAAQHNLEIFGAIALVLMIVSSQMPNRNLMLSVGLCGTLCFAAHFARLGSYTGSFICLLGALQGLLAASFITPTHRPSWVAPALLGIMSVGFIVTGLTWAGWASALALLGSIFATFARLQMSVEMMRRMFLLTTLCWLAHDTVVATPLAMACELLSSIGYAAAILREPRRTPTLKAC